MTPGQAQALEELRAIEAVSNGSFTLVSQWDNALVGVEVSIDTRGFPHVPGGTVLRDRERFHITVFGDFPFKVPKVAVRHARWEDVPHVQWRHHLCLYQAPNLEWNPSDGMFGLVERLLSWLAKASLDELDPVGAPLHPPLAYPTLGTPVVIPRVNTPDLEGPYWMGMVEATPVTDRRVELGAWHDLTQELPGAPPHMYAAAVLSSIRMPFEYPEGVNGLADELVRCGVSRGLLMALLRLTTLWNGRDTPLYVVIGSPMRGVRGEYVRQHLAVWRVDPVVANALRSAVPRRDDDDRLREVRAELAGVLEEWADDAALAWCPVREMRPEVTRSRSEGSPMEWFKGRRVALWGCGALGSHIAESLVRAGVRNLVLRDKGDVAPGLLTRQAFDDGDIGRLKAVALADRLRRQASEVNVDPRAEDALSDARLQTDWTDGCELVIDTTASAPVAKFLERERKGNPGGRVPLVSMMVGYRGDRSLSTYSPPDAPSGSSDLTRKAKIKSSRDPGLSSFHEEFWPDPPRTDMFQPEPGCSEPTFTGSDAEVAALAHAMLLTAAQELAAETEAPTVVFNELPRLAERRAGRSVRYTMPNDLIVEELLHGYEVRLSPSALAEMRAWISRSSRLAPGTETGGVLFGSQDDAAQVIWVSDVLGPPPDSRASAAGFVCGTLGVDRAAAEIRRRTGGASVPLGMWHTHPGGTAQPSPTDMGGMRQLVDDAHRPLPQQLLVIVGGVMAAPTLGAWLYRRRSPVAMAPPSREALHKESRKPDHRIGLALSGGGLRAVAFHLGAMRALHDRGVLPYVDVVSGVSGGSVLAAMWAYHDEDFAAFDERVTRLLRSGMTMDIAKTLFLTRRAPQAAAYASAAAIGKAGALGVGLSRRTIDALRGRPGKQVIEPPFMRSVTRTTALQDVLASRLFGDATVDQPAKDVEVVLNACDLRSGSAFRFGSAESGCARYGRLSDNRVPVALAVAASAAFPLLLPAIDRRDEFIGFKGGRHTERVMLTDGGVYDNLGTTCLEPGRSSEYSSNVHLVDYIVSCDAGYGIMDANAFPLHMPSRVRRSFGATYRKVQDAQKSALHLYRRSGELSGFALALLGMLDHNLPIPPPDLVPRERVAGYPTNFSAMTEDDLHALTLRGEQLTRLVIEHHCPEIA